MTDPTNSESPDRLQRLEEAAGFTEHTVEQLSGEIAIINDSIRRLDQRIDKLTARLDSLLTSGEPPEVDPLDEQ